MTTINPIIAQHIKQILNRSRPRIPYSRDDRMIDFIYPEFSQFFSKIDCYILVLGNTINCSQCNNTLSIDWKTCRCSAPLCKTCIECYQCDENWDENWDDWEADNVDQMARDEYLFGD